MTPTPESEVMLQLLESPVSNRIEMVHSECYGPYDLSSKDRWTQELRIGVTRQ